MMSKKEFLTGAVLSLITIVLLIFYTIDVVELSAQSYALPTATGNSGIIVAWIITGTTMLILLLVIFAIWMTNESFKKLFQKFTLRAVIPGYFVVALLPILAGISIAIITGLLNWGIWLTCLSIPTLVVFILLARKSISVKST